MHLAAKAALVVPTVLKSVFYKIIMSPNSSQEIFIMTILHTKFGGFIKVKLLDGLEYRPPFTKFRVLCNTVRGVKHPTRTAPK
jgi:hypothetical protein